MVYYVHVNGRPFSILARGMKGLIFGHWEKEAKSPSVASPTATRAVPGAFCHGSDNDRFRMFLCLAVCPL